MAGLGKDWKLIEARLRELVPVYEEGNEILSLGSVKRLRAEAVRELKGSGLLLDVGCGPGYMSLCAKDLGWRGEIILLDPLLEMLNEARKRVDGHPIMAVAENLPFRSGSVNAWLAGFSFRDAIDRDQALKEMTRVLKEDGEGVLLDLSKPDNALKRILVGLYWTLSPYLLALRMGRRGLAYRGIKLTYEKLPRLSGFLEPFRRLYSKVSFKTKFLGGVILLHVSGPRLHESWQKVPAYPRPSRPSSRPAP